MKRRLNTHHPLKALTLALPNHPAADANVQHRKQIPDKVTEIKKTLNDDCYRYNSNTSLLHKLEANSNATVAVISVEITFRVFTVDLSL